MVAQGSIFAEVLVVDAGSEDATVEQARGLAEEFPGLHLRIFVRETLPLSFGGRRSFAAEEVSGK